MDSMSGRQEVKAGLDRRRLPGPCPTGCIARMAGRTDTRVRLCPAPKANAPKRMGPLAFEVEQDLLQKATLGTLGQNRRCDKNWNSSCVVR